MKAIITTKELAKILKKSSPVIKKNTVLPILDCVKLEFEKNKLTVSATDLETTIIATMDCECKKPFNVVIPFHSLADICSKVPEPIMIDASGENILITGDTAKFKFTKAFDESHYPNVEESKFELSIEVDVDFFKSLSAANACRHNDNLRPGLNAACIHIKKGSATLVGTDALVLYKNKLKIETDSEIQVMVADQFVQLVRDFKEGKVSIGERFIKVETTNTTIVSRLIDGKFCFYETILPTEVNYNITVNRQDLVKKLGITGVAADLSTHQAVFNFNGGNIKIVTQDIDFGREAEEILPSSGDAGIEAIGINANQVLKLLNLLDSENIEMAFTAPNRSFYIRPAGDPNLMCLVQPIFIN